MEYKRGLASHTGQDSKLFNVTFLGRDSLATSSLISKESSVGDAGNDPGVVSKPSGAPVKAQILTRLSSQKGCPPTGSSCSREEAGESVHGL